MNLGNSLTVKNILGGFTAVLIAGLTVFTTGAGVAKVAGSMEKAPLSVPEVKAASDIKPITAPASSTPKPMSTPPTTPAVAKTVAGATSGVQASTGCIITLWGKQYDVTTLQTTHSGGNVFSCGTDMTAAYQARHGTDLTRMQPYLVTSSTTGANGGTTTIGSGGSAGSTTAVSASGFEVEHETETEDNHNEIEKILEKAVRESDD